MYCRCMCMYASLGSVSICCCCLLLLQGPTSRWRRWRRSSHGGTLRAKEDSVGFQLVHRSINLNRQIDRDRNIISPAILPRCDTAIDTCSPSITARMAMSYRHTYKASQRLHINLRKLVAAMFIPKRWIDNGLIKINNNA